MPDAMDWLLEEDNPPVRYGTLTGLLGHAAGSAEARKIHGRMMDYDATRRILEALYALALAGAPSDPRLSRALDAVRAKEGGDGRWVMENSMNGKMRTDVEAKGRPSKWLTFFALYVLRYFGA